MVFCLLISPLFFHHFPLFFIVYRCFSGGFLISFDPFNKAAKASNFERLSQLVGPVNGEVEFFFNDDIPGCSSVNTINRGFTQSQKFLEMRAKKQQTCVAYPACLKNF